MKHVVHESETEPRHLPGRMLKELVGPSKELECSSMSFGTAIYPPQSQMASHVDHNKDKIIFVLSGYGEIYINGVPEKIERGSCALIPKNKRHSIKNNSPRSMKVAYVISPPDSSSINRFNSI